MKKTLVSALTTALVVGAASTTFAAANPFSDVPADHWAYDAVSQLAADGVIEGYGDSTFRGDRNITRYEMAQMVARAMAKNDVSAANKAMIDKLAAEFADELNNLGVRVSNLERNADMVKWNGKLEYTYTHDTRKVDGDKTKTKGDNLLFRLEPSAEVNEHWHVNARIDANYDMSQDNGTDVVSAMSGDDRATVKLRRAWAQGDYKNFSVRFGKFSMYGDESIADANMSGADLTIGNKNKLSGTIGGGRTSATNFGRTLGTEKLSTLLGADNVDGSYSAGDAFDVLYAGIDYNKAQNKGFFGSVRYYRFGSNSDNFFGREIDADGEVTKKGDDKNNIWQVKAGYQFDKNSAFHGYYAHSDVDAEKSAMKKSYNIEFDYKGAEPANKGTWGAWVAYRHLGEYATPAHTWDAIGQGEKGWNIGANYTFLKNIVGTLQYGDTKDVEDTDVKHKHFFGRVEWFF